MSRVIIFYFDIIAKGQRSSPIAFLRELFNLSHFASAKEGFVGDLLSPFPITECGIKDVVAVDGDVGALASSVQEGGAIGAKVDELFPIPLDEKKPTLDGSIKMNVQKYGVGVRQLPVAKGEGGKLR